VAELSTTSYAVLALLGVRPWTTYELARQMERSLRDMWPRAESVIYEEPKKLVAAGLATAAKEYTGRRASTVYSITTKGRTALRRWLDEPGGPPALEYEGLLKVAFADHGSHDQLVDNLDALREQAEERLAYATARVDEYRETGGPFPERLPVITLISRFQMAHAEMVLRWTEWAAEEVAQWTGVTPATGARVPALPAKRRRPRSQ
jgi:PadR family transcriptional regulator AphA